MKATAAAVRALNVHVLDVIVGCETGVLVGDELSEALGLRTNGTLHSAVRRNKFQQAEAARRAGLTVAAMVIRLTHRQGRFRSSSLTPETDRTLSEATRL